MSALGLRLKQAEEATDKVLANEPEANTQTALRAALSMLGKQMSRFDDDDEDETRTATSRRR